MPGRCSLDWVIRKEHSKEWLNQDLKDEKFLPM